MKDKDDVLLDLVLMFNGGPLGAIKQKSRFVLEKVSLEPTQTVPAKISIVFIAREVQI